MAGSTITWPGAYAAAASVYIFKDEANNWQTKTVPVPAGFEGQGAKNFDGPEPEELNEKSLYEALVRINTHAVDQARGRALADAIAALHNQKRSDGRPVPFHPELE